MAIHGHYHFALQGTAASRPATPGSDLIYYATDTGQLSVYDTSGATWNNIVVGSISNPVTIGQGGTGQTSKTPAFDALSPNAAQGDFISHDGTNNVKVVTGGDYKYLRTDSSGGSATTIVWAYNPQRFALFTSSVGVAFTTGAAYAAVFNGGSGASPTETKIYLGSDFRQARIHMRAKVASGIKSATCKIVNTTDANDLTDVVTFNSGTYTPKVSAWKTFTAPSTSEVTVDCEAIEGTGADIITIENIYLELR